MLGISFLNTWNLHVESSLRFIAVSNEDKDIENRLMDKGEGEEGEGKMRGKSSMHTYTLTFVSR